MATTPVPSDIAIAQAAKPRPIAEVAAELGLAAPRDADKLVRAALARLRRHFGDHADD